VATITSVDIGSFKLDRFESVLSDERMAEIREGADRAREVLGDHTIWHVNSTARGGGVAEMLIALLPYAHGVGVDARWSVIEGDPDFFKVTKRIHNLLHGSEGDGGPLGDDEREAYESALAPNADELTDQIDADDLVVLHDPQTAGLIPAIKETGAAVVWRCHIGLDEPNDCARRAWEFLLPYVEQADAYVFSRDAFVWEDLDRDRGTIIAPTIDVFAPKNQEMEPETVAAILAHAGIVDAHADDEPPEFTRMDGETSRVEHRAELLEERPLQPGDRYVLQVSRWDRLKDPIGVITGFAEHVSEHSDAHLVYAGPAVDDVADDPEGAEVLEEARELWRNLPPHARSKIHLATLPMDDLEENAAIVNALQRGASIVVQKSLAEGFGLTVAEAMWKGRPVVASRIGGIQDQIEDDDSGVLLDDPRDLEAYGKTLLELLDDPERAERIGAAARERVKDRFLGTQSLLQYLALLEPLTRER
jgi:trehalose synthase